MRDRIRSRLQSNLDRVRNLINLYDMVSGEGQGRRPVHAADILRAATVFLHASLEEVFRSLATWKFPSAGEEVLNEVPLVGLSQYNRPAKFSLGQLASHRQKTVQQLIDESVTAYLGNSTINNTSDIASFLVKLGVTVTAVNGDFPTLDPLIARRHHIVHQADRNDQPGQGQHRTRSLNSLTVRRWLEVVDRFLARVLAEVPD